MFGRSWEPREVDSQKRSMLVLVLAEQLSRVQLVGELLHWWNGMVWRVRCRPVHVESQLTVRRFVRQKRVLRVKLRMAMVWRPFSV